MLKPYLRLGGLKLSLTTSLSLNIPGYRNQSSSGKPTQFSAHCNASVIYIDNFYANIGAV